MARDRIEVLRAFVVSRAVVWAAGMAAIAAFGLHDFNAENFDPDGIARPSPATLFGPASYWDSVWFLDIADDGYARDDDAAFFPLYPLLVRVAGFLTGSAVVGGILVSLACLFGALLLLYRLVALDFGERVASLTVLLVSIFPAAVFLSAVYSEALFLLLSVGAVYFARVDRWALAGVAGMLATATRSAGIVLLVPLLLLAWPERRRLVWLLLVPLGLVAFCLLLESELGDGLLVFRAQDAWGRSLDVPFVDAARAAWDGASQIVRGERRTWPVYDTAWLDVGLFATLVATLIAVAGAVRRLPLAYSLYAVAALSLPLFFPSEGQPLMSLPRFVAVLWPLHLWLALVLVERAVARRVVVASFAVGLALVSAEVATWGWIA